MNGASLLHDANWSGIINKLKTGETNTDLPETGSTQVRKHLLFNHCSDRFVKVVRRGRKGVNARGKYKPEMKFSKSELMCVNIYYIIKRLRAELIRP